MEFNLDRTSETILKYIADENKINPVKDVEMIKVHFGDDIDMDYLLECGYVSFTPYIVVQNKQINGDFYSITAKGWAYIQHKPTYKLMMVYPIITSTISAITAIAAILISIFKP